MWGNGRCYWGRKEGEFRGIVVVFAWMSSKEKHVKPYVELYGSLGWNSLICHSNFFNVFIPENATSLAVVILDELIKEVKNRQCPIVFATFSGGPKACMYKVLQIINRVCDGQIDPDAIQLVQHCISGQIYDSPVDFISETGTKFVVHPTVLKMTNPPRVFSWAARAIASSLDAFFLSKFEADRADYWRTLYSSVATGPILIVSSEEDDLAPYQTICNFAQRLQELGGDVKLLSWKSSPHVGHYRHHPEEYRAAVKELLEKSSLVFSQRMLKLQKDVLSLSGNGSHDAISESVCSLRKAAKCSNQSLRRVAVSPSDHFYLPSSVELDIGKVDGPMKDESKEYDVHVHEGPNISAHGVLGKILFDVCVPKNIENWDIKHGALGLSPLRHRHAMFNPIKCIRRSRL
ncbi:hypothetical protein AMTRI_Chr04g248720 [Amborella trichopoda]